MKQKLALLLVFVIAATPVLPFSTNTVYGSGSDQYNESAIQEFYTGSRYDGTDCDIFMGIKGELPQGTPSRTDKGRFNYRLWFNKGIVVYGNYKSLRSNEFVSGTQISTGNVNPNGGYYIKNGVRGEYRYHGYDAAGNAYTNINFIDDGNSGKLLTDKSWLYMPWDNSILPVNHRWEVFKRPDISTYNRRAIQLNDTDTQQWINKTIQGWNIKNGIDSNGNRVLDSNAYRYIHVLTPPGINRTGEGRMWHRGGGLYYQTFTIPMVEKKMPNPVSVEIECITPLEQRSIPEGEDISNENDIIKVELKVKAVLDDEDKHLDDVDKVKHYTRLDIERWEMVLKGEQNELITMKGNISSEENEAWAYYIKDFTVGEIKSLNDKTYTFSAQAHAVYKDNMLSQTGTATKPISFGEIEVTAALPAIDPGLDPPPVVAVPDPVIIHPWFDVVPYPIADNTDMSVVKLREVYINGVKEDDNHFFSGNYVFGIGNHGLKRIDVFYTSTDDYLSQVTQWIYVYDTKPRAQFDISGSFKQNRKITVENTSESANDIPVLENYPINNYQWTFRSLDGQETSIKTKNISKVYKEVLYKQPGTYEIELVVSNTLGRVSDPYIFTFPIHEDVEPAVICNLYNSVLGRNEDISTYFYDAVSTDGDTIVSNTLQLYYDDNNDGICNQLLKEWEVLDEFPVYTVTKLGSYKFVNTVVEEFGEETIPEFVTKEDRKVKVTEREFKCDNYIPMTGVYVDVPIVRPEIDAYIMLDKNLNSEKVGYIISNRMNIDNSMRALNILPNVNVWDMHTYTYSQPASTSDYTGSSYPPSSITYTNNGYSGTLNRTSVSDNSYEVDEGRYKTEKEYKTFTATHNNTVTTRYNEFGQQTSVNDSSPAPSSKTISGWNGSLPRTGTTGPTNMTTTYWDNGNVKMLRRTYTAHYSGELWRNVQVWVPKWVTKHRYTGHYSGTIYKDVRQPYTDPFRPTSYKYVIYITDGNIAELNDLQMVMSKCDGELIVIGAESAASQTGHDYFILNNKSIEEVISDAVKYISDNNKAIEKIYVLAGNGTFNISTDDIDHEDDAIVERKYQYVHEAEYFDNPTGFEDIAVPVFGDEGWIDTCVSSFNNTGRYTIYRRIKDSPSTDPNFADYARYSGTPYLEIYAHRKPVASAELDWDYDAESRKYVTTWVDMSYDLDHQFSREDKGIVERKIMFRKKGGEWNYKIPAQLEAGSYELQYFVRDVENAWSDPFEMSFTLNSIPPPQMEARLRTRDEGFGLSGIPASEYLLAYNVWTRYPYEVSLEMALYRGTSRKSPLKRVEYTPQNGTKTGNDIFWNDIAYCIPEPLSDGTYSFKISAVDAGNSSLRAEKIFSVTVDTPINILPDVPEKLVSYAEYNICASTSKYADSMTVTLYKGTQWQTTLNMSGSQAGVRKTWYTNHTVPAAVSEGIYTAEFRAVTPNGNVEIKTVGYEVETLKILGVAVEGYWNHWRGQVDMFGKQLPDQPHRFLSMEKVKITVDTAGCADRVVIRLSPELEAMRFTDEYGHVYDYADDFFGYDVRFPQDSTINIPNPLPFDSVCWEYSLPLAPSTLSWHDTRLRQPYSITVYAYRGEEFVTYEVNDIDITGNIYDLTYIQPMN